MLGLPLSTEVNRRIPKEKLYANSAMSAPLRDLVKEQIESVIWRNKLAESTLNVAKGETVEEIQVFEVALRQKGIDKRVLPAIAKAIPYKILFVLTCGEEIQAWMDVSGTFYGTDWFSPEGFNLKLEGLNLDALYAGLARQIAAGRLDVDTDLSEAVNRDILRRRLEREIALLEKKVMREKQFGRQVELNGVLKRLKMELEGLCNG